MRPETDLIISDSMSFLPTYTFIKHHNNIIWSVPQRRKKIGTGSRQTWKGASAIDMLQRMYQLSTVMTVYA